MLDQLPVDRACQDRLEIGIVFWMPFDWPVQSLFFQVLEAWEEMETQEITESETDLALAVRIDIVLFNLHLRVVPQDPFDHRCHLGTGAGLELGVNTHGMALNMIVNHDARAPIAGVPLGHEILIPRTKLLAIRCTRRGRLTPQVSLPHLEDRITYLRNRRADLLLGDIAPSHVL